MAVHSTTTILSVFHCVIFSNKYNDPVKIPTLEQCLAECVRLNLLVFIDCKAFAQKVYCHVCQVRSLSECGT